MKTNPHRGNPSAKDKQYLIKPQPLKGPPLCNDNILGRKIGKQQSVNKEKIAKKEEVEVDKRKTPAQALFNPRPVEIFSAFFQSRTGNENECCAW